MNETNYMKLVWITAYLILAGISCWATAESISFSLPSLPVAICWTMTILFFVAASYGTKLIADSFNMNVAISHRGTKLICGIILFLLFWGVFSFPSNTHTFLYRSVVESEVGTDISTTKGYLDQIKNNTKNKIAAELKVNELKNSVDALLGELEAEIKNDANPGFGPKAKEILQRFANLLDVPKIDPLSFRGLSQQNRNQLCQAYRSKIYLLRDSRAKNILKNILTIGKDAQKEVKRDYDNIGRVEQFIDDKTIKLTNREDIQKVADQLNTAYNTIRKHKDFVSFSAPIDQERYTANPPITRVSNLLSIYDTWRSFIKGEYQSSAIWLWIVVSILVDLGAFVFFYIAFKAEEE